MTKLYYVMCGTALAVLSYRLFRSVCIEHQTRDPYYAITLWGTVVTATTGLAVVVCCGLGI